MKKTDENRIELTSVLTCPECGHVSTETMPTDACQYFYDCTGCGAVLRPLPGDCCVYCSYGTVPCPPVQTDTKTVTATSSRNSQDRIPRKI
ncbi:GDCCVxC domain-containing (seleno)protein [Thalassospira povalilytica]|uniref:GDCCVxC domain-containing (seleno)protein n=1 Tax=Thalassospira povalilytica TaxID=732237 RepID=UPI003AA7D46F